MWQCKILARKKIQKFSLQEVVGEKKSEFLTRGILATHQTDPTYPKKLCLVKELLWLRVVVEDRFGTLYSQMRAVAVNNLKIKL